MTQIYYSKNTGKFPEEAIRKAEELLKTKYGFVQRKDYQEGAFAPPNVRNLHTDNTSTIVSFRIDGFVVIETPSGQELRESDKQLLKDLEELLKPNDISDSMIKPS